MNPIHFALPRFPILPAALPATLSATLILGGCGGGGGGGSAALPDPPDTPPPVASGLLVPAEDGTVLVTAVQRALPASITGAADSNTPEETLAPPTFDAGGAAGFSTTYRLEAAVDEHDIVKYDGERMVIAPSRSACCFLLEPLADAGQGALPPPDSSRKIRLLETDPINARAVTVGEVELAAEDAVEGLYLDGTQLVALSSSAWWGTHGDNFDAYIPWVEQNMALAIYDIANPAAPALSWRLDMEGALVASRRVDDQILLVSRHFPSISGLNLFPENAEDVASNQASLENLSAEDLLPRIRINGEDAPDVLTVEDCLVTDAEHPKAPERSSTAVFTTLLSIDLAAQQVTSARCYSDFVGGVYVTAESVYLAHSTDDDEQGLDTVVHRFTHGESIEYRGSGRVPGVFQGGSPDFRMSEAGQVLRLVTTSFTGDEEEDRFDHQVVILEQDPALPELRELARLPNDAQPEEIGKPDEDLYGVRFLGDRAYLVTFELIDPLYVIDLSDPAQPQILGEVELPGFSDLLHPVSADLLLGLGEDGEGKVKVELFDVSEATNPRSRAALTLAEDAAWAWSEARYDRRAFTYLPGDGTDRFTVPISGSIEDERGYRDLRRLYLLEVTNTGNPQAAMLRSVGSLTVDDQTVWDPGVRSVIDGDAVYFLSGDTLWSTFWSDSGQRFGPF